MNDLNAYRTVTTLKDAIRDKQLAALCEELEREFKRAVSHNEMRDYHCDAEVLGTFSKVLAEVAPADQAGALKVFGRLKGVALKISGSSSDGSCQKSRAVNAIHSSVSLRARTLGTQEARQLEEMIKGITAQPKKSFFPWPRSAPDQPGMTG